MTDTAIHPDTADVPEVHALDYPADPPMRLPARAKIGWGVGAMAEAWLSGGLGQLSGPIYTIALQLDPAKMGLIGSLPRFADAIYDIWLGNVSDNSRTRWGRRRPFIAIGAVLSAIFFVAAAWVPLSFAPSSMLAFFGVTSTGYWLAFGTFAIPYNALGYELSGDYNERTSVQAHRYFCIQLAGLIGGAFYPLCFSKIFQHLTPAGVPVEVIGARYLSLGLATLIIICGMFPVLFTREDMNHEAKPRTPLLPALKLTFSDRLFLHFIAMNIISISGLTLAGGLGLFVTLSYVFHGNKSANAYMTFYIGIGVAMFSMAFSTVMPRISQRLGKKGLILIGQALLAAGGLSTWVFLSPTHPWILFFHSILSTVGLACFQVLYGSFIGDICDADEVRTGTRREGMYSAAATFLNKLVYASQSAVSGLILALVGYNKMLLVQGPDTVFAMRVVYAILPGAFAIVGVALILTFPITAEKAAEFRAILDARRAGGSQRRPFDPVMDGPNVRPTADAQSSEVP